MGNCMRATCCHQPRRRSDDEIVITAPVKQTQFGHDLSGSSCDDSAEGAVMRVKILLTREELGWLMVQLAGGSSLKKRSLEELLDEIERGRSLSLWPSSSTNAATSWRPSLESIMEVYEAPDHMDR
ncbi:hypothetical protein SAY87_031974 [Trapa incisa]|uniref:Uncharacterized protein n=1 Tax=Trapa incisa TaxID=236973 RepID=A0AAN7KYQ3_9MYRT|nr:hypothetical protein SAY87_031974 [Trapa incisa]